MKLLAPPMYSQLKASTLSASPKASVVSLRMKSRILSVRSASIVPTKAPAIAARQVAGSSAQPNFTVSTAAR